MASSTGTYPLDIVGHYLNGARKMAMGVATLDASGNASVVTGLSTIHGVFFGQVSGAANVGLMLRITNDVPLAGGTIAVEGTIATEGGAVAATNGQQFSWLAIGNP